MVKKLDHVGIVVNNLDESIPLYERILGVKPVAVQDVPTQNVKAAFFEVGNGVVVELIEPIVPDSGVARFLKKRGQGVHHICFEVDDVDKELKAMAEKGLILPAYDYCLKTSHVFNLLDARGAISVTERIGYILRVRTLAMLCARGYLKQREEMGFPLLKKQ